MSSRGLLRKVRRLEREIVGNLENDVTDEVLWFGNDGGIFGHIHYRFCNSLKEQEIVPCSDEEEVEVMRQHYEMDKHRPWGKGDELAFSDYLEVFSYLGSKELVARQKAAIDRVRAEENGARPDGSTH